MFLGSIELLLNDPGAFVVRFALVAIALLLAITIHEFGHALAAYRLGDTTAKRLGRLTLNPRAHLDPTGTIMVLLAGFGWGKPVPVDTTQLKGGLQGMALVAVAGPLSNVLLAIIVALPFRMEIVSMPNVLPSLTNIHIAIWLPWILAYCLIINIILAVFNLLPINPLDGSQILRGIAPSSFFPVINRLQIYGPIILMVLILSDIVFGIEILGRLFDPVINWSLATLLG